MTTHVLAVIATILNVTLEMILLYFSAPLKWSNKVDRAALIGFGYMIVAIGLDIWLVLRLL